MDDVLIRSTSTSEERKAAFVAGLSLPRVQGCRYPVQGTLLGAAVEVRLPQGCTDKISRAVVLRDDAATPAGPGLFLALLADGHVLVVRDGKATTLASSVFAKAKPKPGSGDPNAGEDEDANTGADEGGSEEALALDECADGEGAGWDVGHPDMIPTKVESALRSLNEVYAELGTKMTVLEGSSHPAAFLPLSGRLRGLWRGWLEDKAGTWCAFVDGRGGIRGIVRRSRCRPARYVRNSMYLAAPGALRQV